MFLLLCGAAYASRRQRRMKTGPGWLHLVQAMAVVCKVALEGVTLKTRAALAEMDAHPEAQ